MALNLWLPRILLLVSATFVSPAAAVTMPSLTDIMQPFYFVTEKFLDFIQPYDTSILLDDVLNVLLNNTSSKSGNGSQATDVNEIVTRYWLNMKGYFLLICIGVMFIITVPVAAIITCCCRGCCHRCGGKGRRMERRGSSCRRGLYGALLVLLTIVMVLGVLLAFISNQLVREQMDYTQGPTLLANISGTLSDMADLLAEIPARAIGNSASAMATLVAAVLPATNVSMVRLRGTLGSSSKADSALNTAMTAMNHLGMATGHSGQYLDLHANYSSNLANLDDMLTFLKANLSGVDSNCPFNAIQSDCDLIASQLPGLKVTQSANLTGLQNVTELNKLLLTINRTELTKQLIDVQIAMDNVSNVALDYIMNQVYQVQITLNGSSELEKIWSAVEKLFGSLGGFINNSTFNVNSTLVDPVTRDTKQLDEIVSNLDFIRYAVYMTIASLSSLVILLWLIGVSYGLCGEPPYEDARCCNRGVGACLLMTGTIFSAICYSLLFIVVLGLFLSGGLADTEVCRYLTGRAGASGYKQLDNSLNQLMRTSTPELSNYSLNLVSGLLDGCGSGNASITAALNIESLVQASNIDTRVTQFVNQANSLLQSHRSDLVSGVELNLNLSSVESVGVLASGQSLSPFLTELQKPLIQGSDSVFAAIQNISLSASRTDDRDRFAALVAYLSNTVKMTEMLMQSELVSLSGLRTSAMQLNVSAAGITTELQRTHDSVHTAYNVEQAINEAMVNLTGQLQVTVRDTIQRVIGAAADCKVVNQKMTNLVRAPCISFLRPFNVFWAGMGLFLICMLPCLILSVKLANLYRKTHRYQTDYVDGDYKNPTYQEFFRISTTSYLQTNSKQNLHSQL